MRFPLPLAAALTAATLTLAPDVRAQFMQCEKLDADQQTQADFCSAHISCRIAVNLLKTCTDVTEAVRKFYDSMGKSKSAVDAPAPEPESAPKENNPARYADRDWKREERDSIRAFMEEDRVLRNEMFDAKCDTAAPPDPTDCTRLGRKGLDLERRLERFKGETRSRRTANEAGPQMPDLYSRGMFTVDYNDRIIYKVIGAPAAKAPVAGTGSATAAATSASAGATSATAPAGTSADATSGAAALPTRAPQPELDAIFNDGIAYADANDGPRAAAVQRAADDAKAATQRAAQQAKQSEEQQRAKEQALTSAMQTGSVGELYALADQLENDGQPDAARKAYRAIVTRFPNHPLAATAANRLGALSGGAQQPRQAGGASGGAGTSGASGGDAECKRQEAALTAEANRLTASTPANASITSNLQVVMLLTSKAVALYDGACKDQPNAKQMRDSSQASFDGAKQACSSLSTNASQNCVPRAPW